MTFENIDIAGALQSIGIAVTIVGGIVTLVLTTRKAKRDKVGDTVDTGKTAIETTNDALAISREAMNQVKLLRDELAQSKRDCESNIQSLQGTVDKLQQEATERQNLLEAVQDWAEQLVHQVQSLGAEPVPFRPIIRKPRRK